MNEFIKSLNVCNSNLICEPILLRHFHTSVFLRDIFLGLKSQHSTIFLKKKLKIKSFLHDLIQTIVKSKIERSL